MNYYTEGEACRCDIRCASPFFLLTLGHYDPIMYLLLHSDQKEAIPLSETIICAIDKALAESLIFSFNKDASHGEGQSLDYPGSPAYLDLMADASIPVASLKVSVPELDAGQLAKDLSADPDLMEFAGLQDVLDAKFRKAFGRYYTETNLPFRKIEATVKDGSLKIHVEYSTRRL